jgi:hypothetical protein
LGGSSRAAAVCLFRCLAVRASLLEVLCLLLSAAVRHTSGAWAVSGKPFEELPYFLGRSEIVLGNGLRPSLPHEDRDAATCFGGLESLFVTDIIT